MGVFSLESSAREAASEIIDTWDDDVQQIERRRETVQISIPFCDGGGDEEESIKVKQLKEHNVFLVEGEEEEEEI